MTEQTTITIPVSNELAELYENALPEDKLKVQALLRVFINDIITPPQMSMRELMDAASDEAQAKGLTPEILAEILADDE